MRSIGCFCRLAKMQNADQSGNAYLPERAPSAPPYLHLQNSREVQWYSTLFLDSCWRIKFIFFFKDSRENLAKMNSATLQSFANVTLPAQHYSSSKSLSNSTSDILDLDALLDDLQSVSRSQTSLNSSPSGTAKFPSRSESFDSGNISTDGHYDESRDEVKVSNKSATKEWSAPSYFPSLGTSISINYTTSHFTE